MSSATYNEIDPFACEWLRRLCDAGEIRDGEIIEGDIRSIVDVERVTRAHFFAGIGLWDLALSLAGWPDDLGVWTGSCPCPFSVAGRGLGTADPRHLWPEWFRLISQCRPSVVFGEQVAGPAGWAWFDALSADLEGCGYAVGASELCAAGVGAPHARRRLYWCAVGDGYRPRLALRRGGSRDDGEGRSTAQRSGSQSSPVGATSPVGHAGSERRDGIGVHLQPRGPQQAGAEATGSGATRGFWAGAEWIECSDGKARAVEPAPQQMADGYTARLGGLRTRVVDACTKEIVDGTRSETVARQAVRDLWCAYAEEAIQWPPGGCRDLHAAPILLSFLRELAREGWYLSNHLPPSCWQSATGGLRDLREDSSQTTRAPHRQRSSEQRDGESSNALSVVSQAIARAVDASWLMPGALTQTTPYRRAPALRCIGNAIVPQVAAAFVSLVMERLGLGGDE